MLLKSYQDARLKVPWHLLTKKWGSVNLYLTRNCNLSCSYCGAIRSQKSEQLSIDQWKKIIDTAAKSHFLFAFTGGEPLLYPGIEALIAHAAQYGLVELQTNGRLLTQERLEKLHGLFRISISLDSLGPEASPKYVDEGFLDRVHRAVEMGKERGYYLSFSAVITPNNLDSFPELVRFATRQGIEMDILVYHEGMPEEYHQRNTTSALSFNNPELIQKLEKLADTLIQMKREGYLIATLDSYLKGMAPFVRGELSLHCRAGRDYLAVDTDGRLMACIDTAPTRLNALDIDGFKEAEKTLVESIPSGCRCWWECWQLYDDARAHPLSVLRERCSIFIRRFKLPGLLRKLEAQEQADTHPPCS